MEKELQNIKLNWFKISCIYNKLADKHLANAFLMRVFNIICIFPGDCTQKKIVEFTGAPKQSVNNVIKDLLNSGYITLVKNPKDKRYKLIKTTKKGKELYKSTIAKIEEAELKVLSNFSDEEITNFVNFFSKYNNLLSLEMEYL